MAAEHHAGTVMYANQYDTVDAMCWRHYGRTAGLVELVLDVNPGLAALGAQLPMGTRVLMPPAPPPPPSPTINLWD